jgi:glycosyltransferase involved in cell wall biosynthesis
MTDTARPIPATPPAALGGDTSISVIIATYNRARLLDECLDALVRQRFSPGDEIIVVDNGSTDDTERVVQARGATCPVPLRYLREPAPGKSHALARALSVARGHTLAFTDDDVLVDEAWIATIRTAFRDPSLALLAGRVDPRWERPAPAWLRWQNGDGTFSRLAAPLAILHYGNVVQDLGPRTAIGANMAMRRHVLDAVGGFPGHLGKLHGTLLSGEDHDVCRRIGAAGALMRYVPDVRVLHLVQANRLRVSYYLRWFFWSGITNSALEATAAPPLPRPVCGSSYWAKRLVLDTVAAVGAATLTRWPSAVERGVNASFAAGYLAQRWRVVTGPPKTVSATEAVVA